MKNIFILLLSVICLFSCRLKSETDDGIVYVYAKDVKSVSLPKDREQCIDAIIEYISADTIVYLTKGVGYSGEPTTQYYLADTLLTIASEGQLKDFSLKHPSAIVRAAVFNALIRKYPHAAVEVAISGLRDMTPLRTMSGCIKGIDTLSMLRVHYIIINKEYFHINDNDYNRLDSVLLFSEITKNMYSYGQLYKNLTPQPHYYQRLQDLYDKSSCTAPIIAIAKYHKKEDKKRIIELLQYVGCNKSESLDDALRAISEWPDKDYKKYVQSVAKHFLKNKETFTEELYSALMCYEEKWVSPLIERSMGEYNSEWNLYCAYKDNPRPYYREMFNKCCPTYKDDNELQATCK